MSAGDKLKGVMMKLVICLFAGFVMSLSSLNARTGKSSTVRYSPLTQLPEH